MYAHWGLAFMLTAVISATADERLTCRDADGSPVDWFYLYKLPRIKSAISPFQKEGAAYAYITSKSPEAGWTVSTVGIDDANSMPGRTLASMYTSNDTILRVLYNDETPSGQVSFTRGHTKGVLLGTTTSGLWLVHSVPKYPPPVSAGQYEYPDTGRHYGQSFLCISLPGQEIDKIGLQLQYNEVNVYDSNLPAQMQNLTNVKAAIAMKTVKTGKLYNVAPITSSGNTIFTSFAKTGKFGKDLYSDLVAPQENLSLVVQSWRDGPGNLPSSCQQTPRTYNLLNTSLYQKHPNPEIKPGFKTTVDHSKWAVAWSTANETPGKQVICVGDINRAEHQETRGGGTVCLTQPAVWNAYFQSVKAYEKCPA